MSCDMLSAEQTAVWLSDYYGLTVPLRNRRHSFEGSTADSCRFLMPESASVSICKNKTRVQGNESPVPSGLSELKIVCGSHDDLSINGCPKTLLNHSSMSLDGFWMVFANNTWHCRLVLDKKNQQMRLNSYLQLYYKITYINNNKFIHETIELKIMFLLTL